MSFHLKEVVRSLDFEIETKSNPTLSYHISTSFSKSFHLAADHKRESSTYRLETSYLVDEVVTIYRRNNSVSVTPETFRQFKHVNYWCLAFLVAHNSDIQGNVHSSETQTIAET